MKSLWKRFFLGAPLLAQILCVQVFCVQVFSAQVFSAQSLCAQSLSTQERGFSGYLVHDGTQVLEAENAERLFVPGSVQKLVTATAALHFLGPGARIITTLHTDGAVREGVLDGDLVLVGAGDPTWNRRFSPDAPHAAFDSFARQVRERGIVRVRGDLVLDVHRFPGRGGPLSRPLAEMAYAWAAPVSALAVDENSLAVRIAPGRQPGAPGSAKWEEPSAWPGWTIESDILTVGRERHGEGTVDVLPDWHRRRLLVRGEYPVSEPSYKIYASLPAPELRVGELLRRALQAQGVTIDGNIVRSEVRASAGDVDGSEIARVVSPPLAELLPPVLSDSHNWYAEMLLRLVALKQHGDGRLETGLKVLEQFLVEEVSIAPDAFALDDGSGLSPWNLITPSAIADLLAWSWQEPWRDVFMNSLARPGKGSLRAWPALPPLRAKTGTLGSHLGIAGYFAARLDGKPRIFVAFLGNRPDERPILRREIAARLNTWGRALTP